MIRSPADIIRAVLIDRGLGTDPDLVPIQAWPVYTGGEPNSPDNVITTFGTTGNDHGRDMVTGEVMGAYGFQVRVRASTYSQGRDKIETIWETLSETSGGVYYLTVNVSGDEYLVVSVVRFGDIIELGKEVPNSKRNLFTFNALINYRKVD